MKKLLKLAGVTVVVTVLVLAAFFVWASVTSGRALARTVNTHAIDFPIPFPLAEEELSELGLEPDAPEARRIAGERAMERGRHLVESRYACGECHGRDFGGGVMLDAFPVARLFGPNLTRGQGSRVEGFTPADWDRAVRHGLRQDGRPSTMPAEDFQLMSDQELSDVIVYILAQPPVDRETPPSELGPVGKVLLATDRMQLSADRIEDHTRGHAFVPPAAEASVEFGRHLAGVCTGCHGADLTGGPIVGGDPSWPPATNLTPHAAALGDWSYEQFVRAMREGMRPDGTVVRAPMDMVFPYARSMTDVEMEALWAYLRSISPLSSER